MKVKQEKKIISTTTDKKTLTKPTASPKKEKITLKEQPVKKEKEEKQVTKNL